jgi:hypothetical protein
MILIVACAVLGLVHCANSNAVPACFIQPTARAAVLIEGNTSDATAIQGNNWGWRFVGNSSFTPGGFGGCTPPLLAVAIGRGVTAVGSQAFQDTPHLRNVTIANTVTFDHLDVVVSRVPSTRGLFRRPRQRLTPAEHTICPALPCPLTLTLTRTLSISPDYTHSHNHSTPLNSIHPHPLRSCPPSHSLPPYFFFSFLALHDRA